MRPSGRKSDRAENRMKAASRNDQEVSTPIISIIMPIYNSENYMSRSIDSVLTQSFDNFELILINDGSNDNSAHICDNYAFIIYLSFIYVIMRI